MDAKEHEMEVICKSREIGEATEISIAREQ